MQSSDVYSAPGKIGNCFILKRRRNVEQKGLRIGVAISSKLAIQRAFSTHAVLLHEGLRFNLKRAVGVPNF